MYRKMKIQFENVSVTEQPRKPYLLIDNRRLDPGNLFVPVKESTELDIQCIVEGGNPKPRLTWDLSIAPTPSTAIDGPDMSVSIFQIDISFYTLTEWNRNKKITF